MSAPTSIREVLDQITTKQHEYRVVEHLVECLRPFIDMDVGRRRTLESEGCLVPFVPQDVIIGKVRWDGTNNFMKGSDLYRVKQVQNGKWVVVWPRDSAAPGAKLNSP